MNESAYLIDSNIWIALTFPSHPGHQAATDAMKAANEQRPAVFCRATQQSFLRLVSTPALTRQYGAPGMTNDDALKLLEHFLTASSVVFQEEPAGLAALWHRLASRPVAAPKLWMDAYLAAFAIAGNLEVLTLDEDFRSFGQDGLKLHVVKPA